MGKTLLLCLLGSISSTNKTSSLAVFSDFENHLSFKHIGDSFFEQTVCDISTRYVCLENEWGKLQTIMNGDCLVEADFLERKKELDVDGEEVTISKNYKEHLTTGVGLAVALMQAGVTQVKDGWAIWEIEEGSIYHDVGLKDGDVITAVNGSKLTGASEAIKILLNVRSDDHWQLDILRNKEPLVIQITVK